MDRITADADNLMKQSNITAYVWMKQAVKEIDNMFGVGYAKEHPELISGFMKAASVDQLTAVIGAIIQDSTNQICSHFVDEEKPQY